MVLYQRSHSEFFLGFYETRGRWLDLKDHLARLGPRICLYASKTGQVTCGFDDWGPFTAQNWTQWRWKPGRHNDGGRVSTGGQMHALQAARPTSLPLCFKHGPGDLRFQRPGAVFAAEPIVDALTKTAAVMAAWNAYFLSAPNPTTCLASAR
jgi:hypothetical protein